MPESHSGLKTAPTSADIEEEKLERDFTDPLSTLPQVLIRDSYTPANYRTGIQTNQLLIRPIIPRVPPRTFLPFVQLIRPTFALVTVPSSRRNFRTEFGDLPIFDIAVPTLARPKENRITGWYQAELVVLPPPPPPPASQAWRGRLVRRWGRFTPAFLDY